MRSIIALVTCLEEIIWRSSWSESLTIGPSIFGPIGSLSSVTSPGITPVLRIVIVLHEFVKAVVGWSRSASILSLRIHSESENVEQLFFHFFLIRLLLAEILISRSSLVISIFSLLLLLSCSISLSKNIIECETSFSAGLSKVTKPIFSYPSRKWP